MRISLPAYICVALATVFFLTACQKRPSQRSQEPAIPYNVKIGVAGFTQPTTNSELLTGILPEDQGRVPEDVLAQLNSVLRRDLAPTKRLYTFLPERAKPSFGTYHESARPQGLAQWTAYGREFNVDLLLVPQVLNWHQREGSSAGVTKSAHVRVEFFLIDLATGRLVGRSAYEEKQVGLVDNILGVGDFLKRRGTWVTAEELAQEAVAKAVKELGL